MFINVTVTVSGESQPILVNSAQIETIGVPFQNDP
jgi:hypothetical protein